MDNPVISNCGWDIDYYYDTNEIANYVKQKLISALSSIHLEQIINTAKNKHFHINNKDIYDLRRTISSEII